jgi:broad specificity phosphatase PhoE
MDYGSWSGRPLKVLSRRPEWRSIQKDPSSFTFPKGESFTSAAARVTDLLNELQVRREKRFLIVSHGDICRILINSLLDRGLNSFQKILIEPGSHSLLMTEKEGDLNSATLAYLNRIPIARATTDAKKFQLGGE